MRLATSLPDEVVQTQLARIVGSQQFRNAPRLSRFLTYVVEQSLAGRSDRLKGYTIGLEVFDKGDGFDPQTDTIVRVQARALRQKLDQYYSQDGADDPVHISIAKGGYEPAFYVSWDGQKPTNEDASSSRPISERPSVAVLPFERMGKSSAYDFIGPGLTEGTISNLSRFKDLSVFSRSTTQKAKMDGLSIEEIYNLFHPDFVVEGSFRAQDQTIDTQIELIAAARDEVIMTDRIVMQVDVDDIYGAQDEIVMRIAARIAAEYGPIGNYAQRVRNDEPTTKWGTYALISRYYQYGIELDQAGRDEIEAGLAQAVKSDAASAEVYAVLAMIEIEQYRAMSPDVGNSAVLARAMEHALLAVQTDPLDASAHQSLALAYYHSRRFVDFRASVKRALHLNPGHSDMLAMFGICFVRLADWDGAVPLLDRALSLNPLHPNWYHLPKAMFLMMTKGPREAIAELEKRPMPDAYAFHFPLLWFHVEAGDIDAALIEKDRLLAVAPDMERLAKKYFNAICLCDEIADRAIAAARKVGLNVVD